MVQDFYLLPDAEKLEDVSVSIRERIPGYDTIPSIHLLKACVSSANVYECFLE
jgi:hypothetical protein